MKTGEWPDAKSFCVACECTDPDHAVNAYIEVDREQDIKNVVVRFYVQTSTPLWDMSRWRAIWNLLRHGDHRGEHHLLLDQQAALNFADTIKESVTTLSKKPRKR